MQVGRSAFTGLLSLFALTLSAGTAASEDGAALYASQCGVCHVLKASDGPRQGPNLEHLFGRKAGSVEGFPYSNGLKTADFEWTPEQLEPWLADPQNMIPDSYMLYKQPDPAVRAKIIDYLKTLKES
ncbi:MAG: cytochrome c family protein [Parvibaculaceae bacterium]